MQLSTVQIAWRNLGRNKKRTALALLAIGVGQFALLASNGLMRGYADNIRLAITGPMIGHVQVHAPEWRKERALDLYIDGVGDILSEIGLDPAVGSAAARIYAPVLVAPHQDAFSAMVVGLDVSPGWTSRLGLGVCSWVIGWPKRSAPSGERRSPWSGRRPMDRWPTISLSSRTSSARRPT